MAPHESLSTSQSSTEPAATYHALADRVESVLHASNGHPRITQITVPIEPADPLQWMMAQSASAQFYWSDRDNTSTIAAIGAADVITAHREPFDSAQLQERLDERFAQMEASARYVGGVQFDPRPVPDRSASVWSDFGTMRFVLPRLQLQVDGNGDATLACNLVLPRDQERRVRLIQHIRELSWPAEFGTDGLPHPVGRLDAPRREEWIDIVASALDAIERNAIEKVVLARQTTFEMEASLHPIVLMRLLQSATPGCFHYLIQPTSGSAFLGASPERLFRLDQQRLWTEAIAGTRSRGDSAQADAALRDELLESEKDRREHAFVQSAIREALDPMAVSVEQNGEAEEMKLARGRHLRSRLKAELREDVAPIEVLDALHPTPAVGGVPTDAALAAIRQYEPFDRGWYAGPVGWIGPEAADFAVAIRSGLVRDNRLALFSGAGIVDGSEPASEWEEIEQKIQDFLAVLSGSAD